MVPKEELRARSAAAPDPGSPVTRAKAARPRSGASCVDGRVGRRRTTIAVPAPVRPLPSDERLGEESCARIVSEPEVNCDRERVPILRSADSCPAIGDRDLAASWDAASPGQPGEFRVECRRVIDGLWRHAQIHQRDETPVQAHRICCRGACRAARSGAPGRSVRSGWPPGASRTRESSGVTSAMSKSVRHRITGSVDESSISIAGSRTAVAMRSCYGAQPLCGRPPSQPRARRRRSSVARQPEPACRPIGCDPAHGVLRAGPAELEHPDSVRVYSLLARRLFDARHHAKDRLPERRLVHERRRILHAPDASQCVSRRRQLVPEPIEEPEKRIGPPTAGLRISRHGWQCPLSRHGNRLSAVKASWAASQAASRSSVVFGARGPTNGPPVGGPARPGPS